ncbi:WD40 repeat-like protein [Dentipellis sp. KUC8613]|nr:WD40 repeat-like protein [Dentipellis sp. KUC8613]
MSAREFWEMDDEDADYVPSREEEEEDDDFDPEGELEEDEEVDLEMDLQDQIERRADDAGGTSNLTRGILSAFFELQRLQGSNRQTDGQSDLLEQLFSGDSPLRVTRVVVPSDDAPGRAAADEEQEDDEDDDEDYEEDESYWSPSVRRGPDLPEWARPPTEPQQEGVELLMSGEFGRIRPKVNVRGGQRSVARILQSRQTRTRSLYKEDLISDLVPNTNGTAVAAYDHNIYSGQFSADSTFYYTCVQDFRLHVYDMTAPPQRMSVPETRRYRRSDHETTMKVMKTIVGHPGRWTITDSHLSPDNERIIYSSITPTVWMSTTLDSSTVQKPLRFTDPVPANRRTHIGSWDDHFGIWSCRFSADGNEVIAGGSRQIFVYDLLADRRTVKIHAHDNDVNSCCWADSASGNVLVSASDDTFLKVWDRRSLGSSPKPSGVLIGHTEGITNVSAKGDGRYIISNGKDQALRLWDLRKMRSNEEYEAVKDRTYTCSTHFDYRYGQYPRLKIPAHPKDCSVMTYRGHSVLQTLIRCHFSPAETTGGQYIYSGSADGKIHIWSLDGRIVQVLDRKHTLPMSFDPEAPEPEPAAGARGAPVCVRDVSWHTQEPVILSAGWENGRTGSVVARHEWKGLGKRIGKLEDWVEKQKLESAERRGTRAAPMRVPGAFDDDSDEEE